MATVVKVDGFNQRIIDDVVFDRVNNSASATGAWKDPEGKAIQAAYKGKGFSVKKKSRALPPIPQQFTAPEGEESAKAKKGREANLKAWELEHQQYYDIYIAQGNLNTSFTKLKAEEKKEEENG